jgi:hypothetical protein
MCKSERRTIDRPKISEHARNALKQTTQTQSTQQFAIVQEKLFET